MARVSAPRLEELVREAEVLSTLKASVPHAWKILEHEIGLARLAAAADRAPASSPRQPVRKRVKLRVPAEQYPDYNFVGRLLGPRGATLKRLERDTGCRIMIRGKGSIRKDKEAEVRGKPGWEHVFHEPLHVVIEVADAPDDPAAARVLARAKEFVEMLLVPVPEERDSLKRAQLRDLAILNGTHRSVSDLLSAPPLPVPAQRPMSSPLSSPPPPARRASLGSLKPPAKSPYAAAAPAASVDGFLAAFDNPPPAFTRPRTPGPYTSSAARAAAQQPVGSPPPPLHINYAATSASLPPVASPPPAAPSHPAASVPPFAPDTSSDAYLPDLEKLRIPSLDFDHLNESNITLQSYGMPAASPTIVDPEIYPYPPTPGLLNVDHQVQLNAFASPVWTPSRPISATAPAGNSAALPPRSPTAPDSQAHPASSFLLGRPIGESANLHPASFPLSGSLREVKQDLAFDQDFAPHAAQVSAERDVQDYVASQHVIERNHGKESQSALANLFPPSASVGFSAASQSQTDQKEQPFELSQQQFKSHVQFLQPMHENRQPSTSQARNGNQDDRVGADHGVSFHRADEARSHVTGQRKTEEKDRLAAQLDSSHEEEMQNQATLQRRASQQHRTSTELRIEKTTNNSSDTTSTNDVHPRH